MGSNHQDGGPDMRSTFNVTVTEHPYGAVVAISGDLDFDTSTYLTEATDALPFQDQTLVLNLSDVTFLDSTGLDTLLRLRRRAQREGGERELCGIGQQIERVLQLTEVRPLFTSVSCP
ncbi:STAS domain-containing protein [Streptomyces sp. NPDC057910]|uniref:STAS domain-containing protein n=1 Tax=Streptomyces sp. NPDC057910 TaxID=3346278 RepID=UPI0036ECDF31